MFAEIVLPSIYTYIPGIKTGIHERHLFGRGNTWLKIVMIDSLEKPSLP
jgi:hypothetical protein